jgi:hypothetical protein
MQLENKKVIDMRVHIIPVLLLLLSSCATTADAMRSWLGSSKNDLVESWGVPDRTEKLDNGKQVLTWDGRNGYGQIICIKSFTIGSSGKVERYSTNCNR